MDICFVNNQFMELKESCRFDEKGLSISCRNVSRKTPKMQRVGGSTDSHIKGSTPIAGVDGDWCTNGLPQWQEQLVMEVAYVIDNIGMIDELRKDILGASRPRLDKFTQGEMITQL